MKFISYAQNFEDVMLWRALKHIKNGFYIDVGAQHPIIDSVSKAFYENGWEGINIEPVPFYADLLRKDRPRDSVLEAAVSDVEGALELNVIPETGLSTAINNYAHRHQIERGYILQKIKVPVSTLKSVTKSLTVKDVHWLKIDVEGLEEEVLKGWDSKTLRPWIIVVEATVPNSPELDYKNWDGILTSADYQFVYFDGLNRFYIANEHSELAKFFSCPPNAFDDFVVFGIVERDSKLLLLDKKNNLVKNELDSTKSQLDTTKSQLDTTKSQLDTTKSQLDTTKSQLDTTKSQLDTTKSQLDTTKSQLDLRVSELETIYYSRGWRFLMYLRKMLSFVIPKESFRRKFVSFSYNLSKKIVKTSLKTKKRLLSYCLKGKKYFDKPNVVKKKINKKSNKVVYISHSYHDKTKSTVFLLDYLKEFFDVEVVWDESWLGKPFPDLSFVDESYLAVIFFQLLPSNNILQTIKNENIVYFPMYDYSGGFDLNYWDDYRNLKIINFSDTLHDKLKGWGFESMYIQYFPKLDKFIPGNKNQIFFWQRLTHININIVNTLIKGGNFRVHIHRAVDPGQEFIMPNKKLLDKFNITYSDWFEDRREMLDLIKGRGVYIAPREYEGIGMSFLEAMAMGKAVIAVDNPTMNEYIKDGVNGYLFDLKNPKGIDLSNIGQVQKNSYEYMKKGHREWEENKNKIIDFIKK